MTRSEVEFIAAIDCRFPLHDKKAAVDLIKEASAFSDEAMMAVLIEIVRLPKSATINKETRRELLKEWERASKSNLKHLLIPLVERKIDDEFISVESVLNVMEGVRIEKNSYFALNLVSSLVYDNAIEEKYDAISLEWNL